MTRKRTAALKKEEVQKEIPVTQPVAPADVQQPMAKSMMTKQVSASRVPKTESKKPKGISRMFRRATSGQDEQQPASSSNPKPVKSAPVNLPQEHRSSTSNIQMHLPTRSKRASHLSISSQCSMSSEATTVVDRPWQPQSSRQPTLSTGSSISPIMNYGGCCKYAHKIRDTGPSAGLMRQSKNFGFYNEQIVFACKSRRCKFEIISVNTKNGYQIDDNIYNRHGLQFRSIFLAKSHVVHENVSVASSFLCLICVMVKNSSEIYNSRDGLLLHILGHRGCMLGDVTFEGPLVFTNTGVIVHSEFDINLSKFESLPPTPNSEFDMSVVIDTSVEEELRKSDRLSRSSSSVSYSTEENPWAV
jgi:hypothetical protein